MRLRSYIAEEARLPDIPEKDRTTKNLPRYADGKPKVTLNKWLGVKGQGGKGYDGKFYGWSHRAIYGYGVGDLVKPGDIGNKYQYSKEAEEKHSEIMCKDGYEAADKWMDSIKFEPYTIKTEDEARDHAIRFGRAVS